MSRIVKLSVHKNTIERRNKRNRAKELSKTVESMVREVDLRAWAIVGIGADGKPYTLWDTGDILPMWAFPEVIAKTITLSIQRSIEDDGLEDGWRPSLNGRGEA